MQLTALLLSLLIMGLVGAFFWHAISQANGTPYGENTNKRRGQLIAGLVALGVVVSVLSLKDWPYALASQEDGVVVNATGAMWWWTIDVEEVPLGEPVTFLVTSEDVNHGMGVYDADMRLLFQTQGMPGYVNEVSYTFEDPGIYRVLCMEYCGVAHHDMIAEFEVVAGE